MAVDTWLLEQHEYRRESDEDIYDPLEPSPTTEDEIYEIEIDTHIATDSHESPVECSYQYQ